MLVLTGHGADRVIDLNLAQPAAVSLAVGLGGKMKKKREASERGDGLDIADRSERKGGR
jgi:hypothetical protein